MVLSQEKARGTRSAGGQLLQSLPLIPPDAVG
jgi:hypothetical protein